VCYSSCNLQWHQLDYMQSICTSLQTGAPHTNTPSLNFYRPNSTQFLVPNQQCQSTEGKQTYVIYPQQLQKSGLALKMLNKCACVILYSMSLEWWGTGTVICLEWDADLHVAQLMPLPLTVSCFSKIQIGFTFLVPAHPIVPEKGPLNVCVCVCHWNKPWIPYVHCSLNNHVI